MWALSHCAMSSIWDGGGGRISRSTMSQPSTMLSGAPPCFGGLPVYKKLVFEFRRRLSRELGMIAVCVLSNILLLDEMAELAFHIDLFSCCACFSDLEAIFDSRAARRVFEDDNIWSIFANASKVERLGGTSKPNEL